MILPATTHSPATISPAGENSDHLSDIRQRCTNCRKCAAACRFLQQHGSPGELAEMHDDAPDRLRAVAYACSLCRQCSYLCPQGLHPAVMMLQLRREAIARGHDLRQHRRLLAFEKTGHSRLFRYVSIPDGCNSVFFPGCSLPGLRPGATLALFRQLQAITPTIGMMLDCCHKISHDLGRMQIHEEYLANLADLLDAHGIDTLVTACPSCLQAFGGLPDRFTVTTAYRLLNLSHSVDHWPNLSPDTSFTIHDPCSVRFHSFLQDDVRQLCRDLGIPLEEMDHARAATFCCGEGGGAGFVAPHLAEAWRQQRAAETGDRTVITYCAGCTASLGGQQPAIHLTELLTATRSSRPLQPFRPIGPLRRWLNRLWLKLILYRNRLVHRQP